MLNQRFIRLFSAILIVNLFLLSETALAVVIQAGRPHTTAEDRALFEKVKTYLEKQLKDCQQCNLTIVIQNGQVRLSGVAPKGSLPHLRKLKKAVPGVKGVNLDAVGFNPQPHPLSHHPGGAQRDAVQFDPQPHPRSRTSDKAKPNVEPIPRTLQEASPGDIKK